MVWLGRAETGRGSGWYLAEYPDEPGCAHLGPPLGRQLAAGRALAEVYAADRITYPDVPSFVTVMSGGAAFPTTNGRMLLAWPGPPAPASSFTPTAHPDPACSPTPTASNTFHMDNVDVAFGGQSPNADSPPTRRGWGDRPTRDCLVIIS
jgi:hypothetical protein